jgi:hypothetical protein
VLLRRSDSCQQAWQGSLRDLPKTSGRHGTVEHNSAVKTCRGRLFYISFVSISSKTVVECSDERPSSSQQAKAIPSAPCNGLLPASSLLRYQVFWSRINALDGDEARQCTHAFVVISAESRMMGKSTAMWCRKSGFMIPMACSSRVCRMVHSNDE